VDELELRVAWDQHVAPEAPTAPSDEWFDAVLARHREPHRRYHGVRHLRWVVRHVIDLAGRPEASGRVADLGAVVAAAFFHDIVYDPTRTDNETVSAQLAERALEELGWPPDRATSVAGLIDATASHAATAPADGGLDTAVLLAADLAVLASDPASYAEYVVGVRAEYAHVSDAAWRKGRALVLRAFTERPAIFDPELRLHAWERRARANLAAELASLSGA
jgi:predicted metal-dependent HD superfamily phosphohydrolase